MDYGEADGYGRYGILATTPDGLLVCHECGQERRFLGRHVREHRLSAAQYRERHGLGRSTPLVARELSECFGESARARVGSPPWQRFEAARDPDTAREASRETLKEPLRAQTRRVRAEQAARASRSRARRVCVVEGCDRPRRSRGWCATHLERWKRTGDVQAETPVRPWSRRRGE